MNEQFDIILPAKGVIEYIPFLKYELFPAIRRVSRQNEYGFHGIEHSIQVALFAVDIALSEHFEPLPVCYAAALHDCARTDNGYNTTHGPACEPIARAFLAEHAPNLSNAQKESIIYTVVNHTIGQNAADSVCACLWDGDRIRLSWTRGFMECQFSTARGKQIASLPHSAQKVYSDAQNELWTGANQ